MSKYIVNTYKEDKEVEIEVSGLPNIDGNGYLRFGTDRFVFNRGSWSYFKKVTEE
jgi:hypothetical protein